MVSNLVGVGIQFAINKFTTEQPALAAQADQQKPGPKTNKTQKLADRTRGPKGKIPEKEVVGGVK